MFNLTKIMFFLISQIFFDNRSFLSIRPELTDTKTCVVKAIIQWYHTEVLVQLKFCFVRSRHQSLVKH